MAGTLFKDPSFEEEREWRIVLRGQRRPDLTVEHETFREVSGTVTPYILIPITASADEVPITEIIVGPHPEPELACEGMLRLALNLLGGVRVRYCNIPLRNW